MPDGILWLPDAFKILYCVVFVRGVTEEELARRLGADPASAVPMTWADVDTRGVGSYHGMPEEVVRLGSAGDWAFAFEHRSSVGYRLLAPVSNGTEAVLVADFHLTRAFAYAQHGEVVTRFEPGMERFAAGTDPRRWWPEMIEAGLLMPDGRSPAEANISADYDRDCLRFAESTFVLDLPREALVHGTLSSVLVPNPEYVPPRPSRMRRQPMRRDPR
ncbi:DUF6461 domain-containing protein [Yinghuangia sp. YIM S09857]|uniref:DUF6461 domain-containing protein n=1 Tax=Yinghuangia sp. YIM S09857 TaxID=3436929 RepID=UPI003F53D9E8